MDESTAPAGVEAERTAEALRIRRRWLNVRHVLAIPFAAVMLFFALGRVVGPLPGALPGAGSIHLYITSGILAIVAIPIAYFALVGLVNSRIITLTRDGLSITDGPLPTPRSRQFDGPAVKSVRFETESFRALRRTVQRYRVDGRLADGSNICIDRIEDNERQARFIYEAIRSFLKKR